MNEDVYMYRPESAIYKYFYFYWGGVKKRRAFITIFFGGDVNNSYWGFTVILSVQKIVGKNARHFAKISHFVPTKNFNFQF